MRDPYSLQPDGVGKDEPAAIAYQEKQREREKRKRERKEGKRERKRR